MNDLISRQEALKTYQNIVCKGICCADCRAVDRDGNCVVEDWLKALPSANQWIPCSKRLPEDIKPVIVTWKNNNPPFYYQHIVGEHFTGVAHYKNDKWFWYSSVTEDVLAEYGRCDSEEIDGAIEVVAWMPLPGAYKGEKNG